MGRTRISAVKAKSGQEIRTRMIATPSPHRHPSAFAVKRPSVKSTDVEAGLNLGSSTVQINIQLSLDLV